ncbi:MAG: hypothetical protein Q7V57_16995 [Actinomycetota bacterium]|nr:hypothetical protein [Actinomycetota bacterium]
MKRRTLDIAFSIGGAVFSVLLLVLGLVLKDQADFAETYVHDQLGAQEIYFKSADTLVSEEDFQATLLESLGSQEAVDAFIAKTGLTSEANSDCLNEYAGQQLLTGKQAECYAEDFIRLHALESSIVTGTGLQIKNRDGEMVDVDGVSYTYASIGSVVTAAKAAVTEAKDSGASEEEVAKLQKQADSLQSKRVDTLLRAETLRGLLLTSYGFSIFGDKADLAATICYLAFAVLMLLSILGLLHAFFSKHAKDIVLPPVQHVTE